MAKNSKQKLHAVKFNNHGGKTTNKLYLNEGETVLDISEVLGGEIFLKTFLDNSYEYLKNLPKFEVYECPRKV